MTARRSDYAVALGKRLRVIRSRLGLTLAEVHAQSGGQWHKNVVGSWERADRVPPPEKLVGLCRWYSADPREVLTGEPVPDVAQMTEVYERELDRLREEIMRLREQKERVA